MRRLQNELVGNYLTLVNRLLVLRDLLMNTIQGTHH